MRGTGLIGCGMLAAALVVSAAMISHAGPLDPPAGAPAPTYKTLSEIEPRTAINAANTPGDADSLFKITQPGSYYLTGNIQGVDGKKGIEVETAGAGAKVVIDLNGFSMTGTVTTLAGISLNMMATAGSAVQIRNGALHGWSSGIETVTGNSIIVENVQASQCRTAGIQVGPHSIVRNCVAQGNNGNAGIQISGDGLIEGCVSCENTTAGFWITASGGVIRGCVANSNSGPGFHCGNIATVTDCTAVLNRSDGFVFDTSGFIYHCQSSANNHDGIKMLSNGEILENLCYSNGELTQDGANIHVLSGNNRIEGNTCLVADRGLDIDVGINFIARNVCHSNTTNYSIAGVQTIGPIITASGTISSTTSPWANFDH